MKDISDNTLRLFLTELRLQAPQSTPAPARQGNGRRRTTPVSDFVPDDRSLLLALSNILYYRCGIRDSRLPAVDNPQARIANMAATKTVMQEHLPSLLEWAMGEAMAKDALQLAEMTGSENKQLLREQWENIQAVYRLLLGQRVTTITPLERQRLEWFARLAATYPGADIWGVTPKLSADNKTLIEHVRTKLQDNLRQRLQHAYAEEVYLLKDILPVESTGQEILYRGMPIPPSTPTSRKRPPDGMEGLTHTRTRGKFNYAFKTQWWEPGRNTFGVSNSMFLPIALKYAFAAYEGKECNEGYLYIIKPPQGEKLVSFSHYGAYGSRFWELTAPQVPTEWIEKRIIVHRDPQKKNRFIIVKVEKNPAFLGDHTPLPAETTLLRKRKQHENAEDKTVADILKEGTVIERRTPWYRKLWNDIAVPVLNRMGKGAKVKKEYVINDKWIYDGLEQQKLYDDHYRKNKFAIDSGKHTSKRKPKYASERQFRQLYRAEQLKERRWSEWGRMEENGFHKEASYAEKLTVLQGVWPALYHELASIGRAGQFFHDQAAIKQVAIDYQRIRNQEGWLQYLDDFRQRLAQDVFGREYAALPLNERQFVNQQVELLDGYRQALKEEVDTTLQQGLDLKEGVYSGIGAKIYVTAQGLLVDNVAQDGPAERAGIQSGGLITAVTQGGIRIPFAGSGLSEEEVVAIFRRMPNSAENILVEYQQNGQTINALLHRDFIDVKHNERYDPLKKAAITEQVIRAGSNLLKQEYQHRAAALPKYTDQQGAALPADHKEAIRQERMALKAQIRGR